MNLIPMNNRIIIKRIVLEEKKSLIFTGAAEAASNRGEVLAVGQGLMLPNGEIAPMTVKVGDVIVFGGYNLVPEKVDGVDVLILVESDVLAIVPPVAAE
jgi:chaperonin GroES